MEFDKALNGLVKYITNRILPTMNDWQSIGARVILARTLRSSRELKEALMSNFYIKTFGFMSEDGNLDIDGIVADLKGIVKEQGALTVNIPLYGTLKLNEVDLDEIRNCMEG